MRIGPYEVARALGQGGGGRVYEGGGPDGARVAIKVLPRWRVQDDQALLRFAREGRLQGALGEEQGFVPLLDSGESPEGPYLVMPYLSGGTLADRLAEERTLPIAEVVALGRALAAALGAAHARGIVHRDLKPANVLFTGAGRALVADLGLSKHFRRDLPGASASGSLSVPGQLRGTPVYMPPEQFADSKHVGPTADVFALGALLYECLAGQAPLEGATLAELVAGHGSIRPVEDLRPETPPWLAAVVRRALAADPARRFQDGAALARALAGPTHPARRLALGLALLAGAAGVAAALALRERPAATPRPLPPGGVTAETMATPAPTATLDLIRIIGPDPEPGWMGHEGLVSAVAFLPGERAALSAGAADGCLNLWDLATREGRTLQRLSGLWGVAASPDGARALMGGGERGAGLALLLSLPEGSTLHTLRGHTDRVYGVSFSPDGRLCATASWDGLVKLWDVERGAELHTLRGHALNPPYQPVPFQPGGVYCAVFAPNGRCLASGGNDTSIRIWEVETGASLRVLPAALGRDCGVLALAYSPDGLRLLAGTTGQAAGGPSVGLFEAASGELLAATDPGLGMVWSVAFLPDGARALLAGDRGVALWTPRGDPERQLITRESAVGLAPSRDGQRFLRGGVHEVVLETIAARPRSAPVERPGHAQEVRALTLSPSGELFSASLDGTLRRWSQTGQEELRLRGTERMLCAAIAADPPRALVGTTEALALWDLDSRAVVRTLTAHQGRVNAVALLPAERALSAGQDGALRLWDLSRGAELAPLQAGGEPIYALSVSTDARRALSASTALVLWDLDGVAPIGTFAAGSAPMRAALLPDGKSALSARWVEPGLVQLTAFDGSPPRLLGEHGSPVRCLAVSPDGRWGLTGGEDRRVVLWDLVRGERRAAATLARSTGAPRSALFSPDGATCFVGTGTGSILCFRLPDRPRR